MGSLPLNIFTLPLWWYTTGTTLVLAWAKKNLVFGLHKTGILLFAKHMREPLYGDYTKSGIILSFFLRIVLLAFKLLVLTTRAVIVTIIVICYLLLLPLTIVMTVCQFTPLQ